MLASVGRVGAELKNADTAKGKAFVDAKGMTLYTFDKDAGGSRCATDPARKTGRR